MGARNLAFQLHLLAFGAFLTTRRVKAFKLFALVATGAALVLIQWHGVFLLSFGARRIAFHLPAILYHVAGEQKRFDAFKGDWAMDYRAADNGRLNSQFCLRV